MIHEFNLECYLQNVPNKSDILFLNERVLDFKTRICFFLSLNSYADNISTPVCNSHHLQAEHNVIRKIFLCKVQIIQKHEHKVKNLFYCRSYILSISCCHCLNSYWVFTAKGHISHHHRPRFSPNCFMQRFTILLSWNCMTE